MQAASGLLFLEVKMKIDKLSEKLQKEIKAKLDAAEDKSQAILEAAEMVAEEKYKELIKDIQLQSERAAVDEDYRKNLGLRVLSQEEEEFYEKVKDVKQAVTAEQIDIIPTTIVDKTLADIEKNSGLLASLVKFAPANVKKWLVGTHSGDAVWGDLTDAIKGELSAVISSMDIEVRKLSIYMVIPKAIRDLSLPFVDKYFRAILQEGMEKGLEKGYISGDGKTGPIGITKKIESYKSDGTAAAKEVLSTITKFSPKGLVDVRKTLSNRGKRVVSELHLICNPLDEAEYVDPCMYGEALVGGYKNTSFMPIVKHVTPNCPQGTGIFTIKGVYTMGATSVEMKEYDQTKALDDADLIIGKCYANGRADDDNCAVVFDITKLEEYVLPVTQVTA